VVAQLLLHAPAAHAKGAQPVEFSLETTGQLPRPSQLTAIALAPLKHPASRQTTDAPTKPAHDERSTPSQTAARQGSSAVPAPQAAREPCGFPETGTHVPSEPMVSQASHCPLQGALQQCPSAQKPVWQASLLVHGCP
jgi:hypothetical protein